MNEQILARVAWVPNPHRYGGYSAEGIEPDGGHFASEFLHEQEARQRCNTLAQETHGSAGGYIVVYAKG